MNTRHIASLGLISLLIALVSLITPVLAYTSGFCFNIETGNIGMGVPNCNPSARFSISGNIPNSTIMFLSTPLSNLSGNAIAVFGDVRQAGSGSNIIGVMGYAASKYSAGVYGVNDGSDGVGGIGVQGDTTNKNPGSVGILGVADYGGTDEHPNIAVNAYAVSNNSVGLKAWNTYKDGVALWVPVGKILFGELTGDGDAFLCIDSNGIPFRKMTPCR